MPLQAENGALQGLVVDMAADKAEAKQRLTDLRKKYQHLLQVMQSCIQLPLLMPRVALPGHPWVKDLALKTCIICRPAHRRAAQSQTALIARLRRHWQS